MPIINKRIEEAEGELENALSVINDETTEAISQIVEAGRKKREVALEDAIDSVLN